MQSASKTKIWTIPNLLSLMRIALVPLIVWSYLNLEDGVLAGCLLVLSGATDIADGIIARRFNMISDLGKVLDPVADKLTQGAMLICLVALFPKMLLPLILLAVKELFGAISQNGQCLRREMVRKSGDRAFVRGDAAPRILARIAGRTFGRLHLHLQRDDRRFALLLRRAQYSADARRRQRKRGLR